MSVMSSEAMLYKSRILSLMEEKVSDLAFAMAETADRPVTKTDVELSFYNIMAHWEHDGIPSVE